MGRENLANNRYEIAPTTAAPTPALAAGERNNKKGKGKRCQINPR
ncbi:hypothetical protein [Coxiella-like endosymbiont of Rhipicephalus sanguineus]|nr:hypothetical protein [Coxiella-like endosymbiont of Rhipicephalus sanguineus]